MLFRVVYFSILPDQMNVFEAVLNVLVHAVANFLLDSREIHGVFDDDGIVKEVETLPIDGEAEGFWVGSVEEILEEQLSVEEIKETIQMMANMG